MLRKAAFASFTFALLFLSVLFSTREARADAVVIQSGHYFVESPFIDPPRYIVWSASLQARNFRAESVESDGSSQRVSSTCPYPCEAGSTFSVNTRTTLFTPSPGHSFLEVNGKHYNGWFGSDITFTTDEITIPANAVGSLTLTTHFTMSGLIGFDAYDLKTLTLTPDIFSSQVTGSGTAFIEFRLSQYGGFDIMGVTYNFTAVPEPATMILLGTGLAGIAARGRKRRRARKQDESLN